ncbi:MAG: YegS/Rv2252/BmrU family lipid kinase [Eubacteriales bacterium]
MKHIFIINPIAGAKDISATLIPQIKALKDIDYRIEMTEYVGHAREIARKYASTYEEIRIYACGGDGTLNEVIIGSYGYPQVEIACVPCGSGNDFIKVFGKREDFFNLEQLVLGKSIEVDIMKVNDKMSASICSVGFDANVAYGIKKYKRIPLLGGRMAYNMSVIENYFKPLGTYLEIEVDGKQYHGDYLLLCVANGTTYGGGFKSAPMAKVNDGIIDIVLVKKINRLFILKLIAKYATGNHIINEEVIPAFKPYMTYIKGERIRINSSKDFTLNIDGECEKINSLAIEILKKEMKFVLPQGMVY